MNKRTLLNLALITFALLGLGGCSQTSAPGTSAIAGQGDIHERLSNAIRKSGYEHGIMIRRENDLDIDSIFISVPLDGVKQHHPSLEKLLMSLGNICALPEYAYVLERFELDASDYDNFLYMRGVLEKALGGRPNTKIIAAQTPRNAITVTLIHTPFKKAP
jgi:hypothetical protein